MGGRLLGYARVSVADQRLDLQLDALRATGVPDHLTFTDHGVSGARAQRPGLDRLLEEARDGDTVVCWRLDRLGRSLVNLSTLTSTLTERGVHIRTIADGVDTGTSTGRLLLGLLATLADWEREVIRERVIAGGLNGLQALVAVVALIRNVDAPQAAGPLNNVGNIKLRDLVSSAAVEQHEDRKPSVHARRVARME